MNQIKRIITAVILIPAIVVLLYFTDATQFIIITALIFSLILKEWNYVANIYYKGFIWVAWVVNLTVSYWFLKHNEITWLYFICGFWCFLFVLVFIYPTYNLCKNILFRALSLMIFVFGSWLALNQLYLFYSPHYLMFMFVVVWASDTGGYYFGRSFGEIKLAPFVSPNKTVAGLMGSFIVGIGLTLIAMPFGLNRIMDNYYLAAGVAFVIVFISVMGDLVESMFKRELGIKESGRLLPGHGGIVDRTDSLVAAAPFFLLIMTFVSTFNILS